MLKNLTRPLKVFLCYAVEDERSVIDISEHLVQDGVQPWLYKKEVVAGQILRPTITKAVEDSDAVIVFLSKTSVVKNGFIQEEIRSILKVAKKKPAEGIFLIPAKLEECQVPSSLNKLVWVELYQPDGYEQMQQSLWRCAKFHRLVISNPASTNLSSSPTESNIIDEEPKVEQTRVLQQNVSVVGPIHPAQARMRPIIESVAATVLVTCSAFVMRLLRPEWSDAIVYTLSGLFLLALLLIIYISFRRNRKTQLYIWTGVFITAVAFLFFLWYTNPEYQSPIAGKATETTAPTEASATNATQVPSSITSDPTATNTEEPIVTLLPTLAPTSFISQPTALPLPDAVVNSSALNLRSGPSMQYGIITTYHSGDNVKITGKDTKGEWLVVQMADGNSGWMSVSLLIINISLSDVPIIDPPPTPTSRPTIPQPTRHPPTVMPTEIELATAIATIEPPTPAPLPTPTIEEPTPTDEPKPRSTPMPTSIPTAIPP